MIMLETPHVVLGAAIATAIPNPLVSIPLAFASHFLLDMTPHWNPHLNTEIKTYGKLTMPTLFVIGFDLAMAAVLTGFLTYRVMPNDQMAMNILLSSLAAILPDVVEGPYFLFGWRNKFLDIWMKLQKRIQSDANIFWGSLTQIATLIICLYTIIF